jgi:hypothetical protein
MIGASYIYPGFMDVDSHGKSGPLTCAWVPAAQRSPAYFHGCLFGVSSFMERHLGQKELHSKFFREQLWHKLEAMRHIGEALTNTHNEVDDETILAVFQLSCNELNSVPIKKTTPTFHPLLQSLQWLDLYGQIDFVEEHWAAFTHMINQRGGLNNIKLMGVKEMIRLADGLRASKKICKPSFPSTDLDEVLVKVPPSEYEPNLSTFPNLFYQLRHQGVGHGFQVLTQCGIPPDSEAIAVFSDLAVLSATLKAWGNGNIRHPYMIDIANVRLNVQHRLLSLPGADEPLELGSPEEFYANNLAYEACRLTCILYAVSVTFPVPTSYGPQKELFRRIKDTLALIPDEIPRELKLWCLMIGGIASMGQPERIWYASEMGEMCKELGIKNWDDMEEGLRKFAWLERSCEPGGRSFVSFL